ncbi:hypothetical protein LAZ44_17220 [Vibrio alginolyticus]|uniref:hypothetical protein n=1 Tax=Vibrio TaxID=662 RepID=UPI001CDB67BE|nr:MULTISPECIES: hypothetical protein [Vibrio]MCA2451644.1 hypothetical protein [Vibrio alginolyticus]MCA2475461.1 hypothetical protein [Vibrio alginolyticus]MCS0286608.1 hypothetical protein [Vibrio alginolyticus]MDW2155489.1 hypothetical protein [Vibrio sp. 2092]MDW2231647.1 hypothetical protein [Vibrio sp. 2091]
MTDQEMLNSKTRPELMNFLEEFVKGEGFKIALTVNPEIQDDERVGLDIKHEQFPTINNSLVDYIGSELNEAIKEIISQILPKVTAIALAKMAGVDLSSVKLTECDCEDCQCKDSEHHNESDESKDDRAEKIRITSSPSNRIH